MNASDPRHVTSADGTSIAYWSSGTGPPLLMVHGAMSDHRRWRITPLLEPHRTVHLMDRRGRGGSGDGPDWSLEREVQDVVAVLEALAEAAEGPGGSVDLLGHSLGGLLALRAAARSPAVRRLVLYEAAVNEPAQPGDVVGRLESLVGEGRGEDAVVLMMREVVGMPEEEVAAVRAMPTWPSRVEAASTLPRELGTDLAVDAAEVARVRAPTLLITGSDSPPPIPEGIALLERSLPTSRTVVIEGQGHVADQLVPEQFARIVLDFLLAES